MFRSEVLALKELERDEAGRFALKNRKSLDDVRQKSAEDAELR